MPSAWVRAESHAEGNEVSKSFWFFLFKKKNILAFHNYDNVTNKSRFPQALNPLKIA